MSVLAGLMLGTYVGDVRMMGSENGLCAGVIARQSPCLAIM